MYEVIMIIFDLIGQLFMLLFTLGLIVIITIVLSELIDFIKKHINK